MIWPGMFPSGANPSGISRSKTFSQLARRPPEVPSIDIFVHMDHDKGFRAVAVSLAHLLRKLIWHSRIDGRWNSGDFRSTVQFLHKALVLLAASLFLLLASVQGSWPNAQKS